MAINLKKNKRKNSCLVPLLVTLAIIGVLILGIGLIWGACGYMWTLRVIGILFALIALGALSSQSGVGCLALIVSGVLAALCFWGANTIEKNYVKPKLFVPVTSMSSSQTSQTSTYNSYGDEETDITKDNSPYMDNRLQTGASPYKNAKLSGNESTIEVKTSAGDENDVVVIIKHNGKIVRNAYIRGGDSYQFSIPNGTYQVFFYGGKGWNPDKEMSGGYTGGFVANESFSKDNAVTLDYQGLNYELILQRNGNFNTEQSSETEMF